MPGNNRKQVNGYTTKNRVRLVAGGADYFTLLEQLIDKAQHSVQLQVYIFESDATGTRIGDALMRAAARGVAVYLMADGYASQHLSKSFVHELKAAGVHFRFFEQFLRSRYFYIGRRMHHKVAVVDARYAIVGGINIADRYNDFPGAPAWLDTALYIEGEAAITVFNMCRSFWGKELELALALPADLLDFLQQFEEEERCSVRIRRNDWLKRRSEIWKTYFDLFNHATESITLMCSYFLPGRRLRKAMAKAVARGANVRVVLAGPSDVLLAKRAERYLYNWLLRAGIDIYEFQPTVLHAKIAVIDDHWVTIGSYNVNNVSTYASIELNADVRNRAFAHDVATYLDTIVSKYCNQVTADNFRLRVTYFTRLVQHFSYWLVGFVVRLSTFYFKRQD
jgi:cardiolipin synthase